MTFRKEQLLIIIVGSVLSTLVLAWVAGWGWGVTFGLVLFFVVFDVRMMQARDASRLRNWYLLRRRQPPDESSLVFQAHAQNAVMLWFVEIVALGFVAIAIFLLVKTPQNWLTVIAGLAFFGLCGAFNTYLLVLRYTAAPPRSPNLVSREKRLIGGD